LGVYAVGGYVFDQFHRRPWELSGGLTWWPFRSQQWRINAHYIHVVRSPTGSFFGYYSAGQTGSTYSVGSDILF
jgi:hypothetical protein